MIWRYVFASLVVGLLGTPAQAGCEARVVDGKPYSICSFDLTRDKLALFNLDDKGEPLGSFDAINQKLAGDGKALTFAMNAGMFDQNLRPIGLYIEKGVQAKKLNRRQGPGNFHMKPNGVFYLSEDKAGVVETDAYAKLKLQPTFATQSGPMLVIDGEIHPNFSATGTSYKTRNGVGVVDDHTVVFVISENAVNFHQFATLFRDELKCQNALFLDGSVSSLFSIDLNRDDGFVALGPMVGAWEMR